MRKRIERLASLITVATLGVAGCAVGPNFNSPSPPAASGYVPGPLPSASVAAPGVDGGAQRFVVGQDIPGQWWTLFHSQGLSDLVGQAIASNADLAAAKAALRIAQENYYAQRGALLPTIDAGYNLSRQKASNALSPPLNSPDELFTLHTAQVAVGFTPDVFGGIRRQTESVKAQAEAQRFQAEATYLTLTSSVVEAAIQQASLQEQVAATKAIGESARQILNVMNQQLQQGQIARADVAAQEALLAQARQALAPLEKQLAQQTDLVAALTGHAPSDALPHLALAELSLPLDLPVSLPAKLVRQRPDVRAAEASLHAASAQVGVAIAGRLPTLDISANAGGTATTFQTLLSNGNTFWSVAGNISQPIFEGGALLHRQRAAEAGLDQAKEQYRSTVLSALQNVADTLQALQSDARALQAATASERAAAESLAITRKQLELGQINGLPVLIAQQTYQQAVIALVQARVGRYADTVALFQSLGGGWWNRDATPGKSL